MVINSAKKIHKMEKNNEYADFSYHNSPLHIALICGESLAVFLLLCYLISILGFWINLPLLQYSFIPSLVLAIIFGYVQCRKNTKIFFLVVSLLILCIAIPPTFTSQYYDFGWDSNVFHELIIISLSNGQNPIYNPDTVYLNQTHTYTSTLSPHITDISDWVRDKFIREAKGYHIIAGSFFSFTHNLQSSKSITIIASIMSILLFFSLLSIIFTRYSPIVLFLLSIVAALNSVVICSSLSFYTDGFLYASLLSLISLLGLYFVLQKPEFLYIALGYTLLFMNIKSTAIIFTILLFGTFGILFYIYKRELLRKNIILILPFLTLCVVCSYHPYIYNYLHNNDVSGGALEEAQNFGDIPSSWKNLSTPEKFILSLFSKADVNPVAREHSDIKIPLLDISDREIYINDPAKVGGWGPLFSGIIIIAMFFFAWQLYRVFKERKIQDNSIIFFALLVMIGITILVFPLSWYARYVPQVALIPLLMILPYLKSEEHLEKTIRIGLALLLLVNVLIVAYTYYTAQQQFTTVQNTVFSVVKEKAGNTIYIKYEGKPNASLFVYAYVYDLINKGIDFKINPSDVPNGVKLPTIIERDFVAYGSIQSSHLK